MAGKRSATSDLNHDNWDRDEEPEDAGTFQKASEESIKRRIIKTARRRNPISSVRGTESETKSAFTGFTGFTKTAAPVTTSSFSFLSNITTNQTEKPNSNGTSGNLEKPNTDKSISFTSTTTSLFTVTKSSIPESDTKSKSNDFYSKLKGLNESVLNWIKQHVDANPLINLQPVFKDYERYFKDLEIENDKKTDNKSDTKKVDGNISTPDKFVFGTSKNTLDITKIKEKEPVPVSANKNPPNFSFGTSMLNKSGDGIPNFGFSSTSTSNTFSFGTSTTSSPSMVTPSFSFGGNVSSPNSAGFSFTGSSPFKFNNVAQPASANDTDKKQETEEEDEPPKFEFTPVIEKDHVFTTRCKVFVKKGEKFNVHGVGNLYLKPIEKSEKVQLIVRADNNLGTLVCNFILASSIPIKKMGNKDVMLICLPTPDFEPPTPTPILLRLKSPEEADNLLEALEKHKK